jgi:hypothetical protein
MSLTPGASAGKRRSRTLRDLTRTLEQSDLAVDLGISVDPSELGRLSVPDTPATREAEAVCRESSGGSLTNHCLRSYAWGVLLGLSEGISFDAESLYAAAMMHDLGLTPAYDRGQCFETDGADAAREILSRLGWLEQAIGTVSEAIYLHMHDIPDDATGEARLLALGTSADVSGRRVLELAEPTRDAVLRLFPRLGFKRLFIDLFEDQARRKPNCIVHRYMREYGLADLILAASYDE